MLYSAEPVDYIEISMRNLDYFLGNKEIFGMRTTVLCADCQGIGGYGGIFAAYLFEV